MVTAVAPPGAVGLGLKAVFPDCAGPPVVVSDSPALLSRVRAWGLATAVLGADGLGADGLGGDGGGERPVVLAVCGHDHLAGAVEQVRAGTDAPVLWVPAASFDGGVDAAAYTVALALRSDYAAAAAANREWIDLLGRVEGPLVFRGPGTDIACQVHEHVEVETRLEAAIPPGAHESVGAFFEVAIETRGLDMIRADFTAWGTLAGVGMTVAVARDATPEGRIRFAQALALRDHVARRGPARVTVEDGRLMSVVVDGTEVVDDVVRLTNPRYDGHLVEFGIGSNQRAASLVEWRYNSQMNEGVTGVHLGLGEGITGAHIDFISPGSRLAHAHAG
jgi:hypothetical protein